MMLLTSFASKQHSLCLSRHALYYKYTKLTSNASPDTDCVCAWSFPRSSPAGNSNIVKSIWDETTNSI